MPAAVSGDVAADLLAPWRRPDRAVVYADPSGRPVHDELTAAALTPSGAGEATLELIVPADPGVWPAPGTTAAAAVLPLADPIQLLWNVARAPGADVDQAVAAMRPVLKDRAAAAASRWVPHCAWSGCRPAGPPRRDPGAHLGNTVAVLLPSCRGHNPTEAAAQRGGRCAASRRSR
jgi:hypothetical protein